MSLLSMYSPGFPRVLTYMLQSTEYRAGPYSHWFWRTQDFGTVTRRRQLVPTLPARLLLFALRAGMLFQFALGVGLLLQWAWQGLAWGWPIGLALIVSYPVIWAHLVTLPLVLGRWMVIGPRQTKAIKRSAAIFANHPGVRVAVAGSYGKTSMKELLLTVLSEGKKVAATPANKNVSISHAAFAAGLDGDEDVLIIEYGEGQPGDIRRFAQRTHPTHAVITGLAPAHLDRYKSLQSAGQDIFSLAEFVPPSRTYVNAGSPDAIPFIRERMHTYDERIAHGWDVSDIAIEPGGTSFSLSQDGRRLSLTSGLLGRHTVGPLAFAAAFGLELGLSEAQVAAGIARTRPYEHRMRPLTISGALVIDDTYNGNLEGIRAGTTLLAELPARRKWYVTPGLVDQGRLARDVHREAGRLIAAAKPDIVVLMANSVQPDIAAGLKEAGYAGDIRIEHDPLKFYTNLPHFLAAGDLMLMQNDWTDNYA